MTVDCRRRRRAEPRRRDRRRGDRLHRGDDRGVHRGGAVRSGAHRRDRPQAQHRRATRATASSAASIRHLSGPGLEIATRLILELCGGEASEVVIAGAVPDWRRSYVLRAERPATLGGLHVPHDESRAHPRQRSAARSTIRRARRISAVEPPSWRGDIVGEADLVEEVLRIKGYDQIPAVPLERARPLSRARRSTPAQRRASSWSAAPSPRAG